MLDSLGIWRVARYMQIRVALITRPDHETVTKYLCLWSEEILALAKHKGISIYDLKGKKANRKAFESYVFKHSPSLVLLNGHGNAEIITGYDNETVVDKDSVLENSVVYGRSCDAGQTLGNDLVNKGARTFIGYKRKFILGYTPEKIMKPLEDPIARLFLEPSNLIATSLIKGNSTLEAHRRSCDAMSKNFRRMLSSIASFEERHAAPWLWSNMNSQVLIGDQSAFF